MNRKEWKQLELDSVEEGKLLDHQDTCPKCSANWKVLQEDLETEPLGSYELDQTLIIIENCPVCQLKFKLLIETCRRVFTARRLGQVGIEVVHTK